MTDAIDIRDDGPTIVATVLLRGCTADRALAAFTDPAILSRWWRGQLTTAPGSGGPYTVDFPPIPAKLTGQVQSFEPGRSLEFTWSWDEQPPDSTVLVAVEPGPEPDSVLLNLKHSPHNDGEAGRQAHQEHWDGWSYFLPRLAAELVREV